MSVTRSILEVSELYTKSLEEVLDIKLDRDSVKTRAVRSRLHLAAESVRKISEGLTRERGSFLSEQYLSDPDIRTAYQLYYTTTNFLKVIPPLREIALTGFFKRDAISILDLGSGTGAALWGLFSYLEQEHKKPINFSALACDVVPENLKDLRRFYKALSGNLKTTQSSLETMKLDLRSIDQQTFAGKRFDLIVLMNTLNELTSEAEMKLLSILPGLLSENGMVLLIEPATRNESRRLLTFRDAAVENNWTIFAPCTRQANCPALVSKDNWCHSEYKWARPDFIRVIDDEAATLRLSLKSTYITMSRSEMTMSQALQKTNLWRSVSERFDEKGRTRSISCGEQGRHEFILNKRDKGDENREFMKVERYDIIEVADELVREHDRQITKSSKAHIVLPVLGA